jgi:AraC family transcriptional activator of pobA
MKKNAGSDSPFALRLYDPRFGTTAFTIRPSGDLEDFSVAQKWNYFTILWVERGRGTAHADLRRFDFESPAILFFNPYQTLFLESDGPIWGKVLQFHANFFCIETHHDEVGCNGILFNDLQGLPLVDPSGEIGDFETLHAQMEEEFRRAALARSEMLLAYLKVFLIRATRLKREQQGVAPLPKGPELPLALAGFLQLLEENFLSGLRPADYAERLHVNLKTLSRLAKAHLGRSVGQLIRERKMQHAKWHLLHSRKPVKQVAWETGFADEYYFSRLFKESVGMSPSRFREFETRIRGGSNLSS